MDFVEIGSLLSGGKHFIIPDYQREYSWERLQNQTLWQDLLDLMEQGKKHFLGALVTSEYDSQDTALAVLRPDVYHVDESDVYHLLDGQQRLTSVSLLIAALDQEISEDCSLEPNDKQELRVQIHELLFDDGAMDSEGRPAPRLFLKEQSGKYYYKEILKIRAGSNADKRYKSVKNMVAAFEFYRKSIQDWNDSIDSKERYLNYKKLLMTLKGRVQVVDIRCSRSMNEFQVFESLNGKGLNLTAVDRIKSIYLSAARRSNVDGATKWQSIYAKLACNDAQLLHFFTALFFYRSGKRISRIALPEAFKRMTNEEYPHFNDLDTYLQDSAEIYGSLRKCEWADRQINEVLSEFVELGQDQIYVPLFAAAYVHKESPDDLLAVAKALLTYAVRYSVCGRPTNALDSEFSKMIDLEKERATSCEIVEYIASRTEKDDKFEMDFKSLRTKKASFARYLLRKLENQYRLDEDGNGNPAPEWATLEHIIPKEIDYEKWYGRGNEPDQAICDSYLDDVVSSIGNMVLINRNDNSAASNRDYKTKLGIYKHGSTKVKDYGNPAGTYKLVALLIEDYPESFDHTDVEKRAQELARKAKSVWRIQN